MKALIVLLFAVFLGCNVDTGITPDNKDNKPVIMAIEIETYSEGHAVYEITGAKFQNLQGQGLYLEYGPDIIKQFTPTDLKNYSIKIKD